MLIWERFPLLYQWYRTNPLSGLFLRAELISLKKLLTHYPHSPHATLLDIGTGSGFSLKALPLSGTRAALDICAPLLQRVHRNYPHVHCLQANAEHLPFHPCTFDLIAMIGVTDYILNKERLLTHLAHILKPHGYLLITFAPHSLLNSIRYTLGHRLRLLSQTTIHQLIAQSHLTIVQSHQTALQIQYLVKKKT